MWGPSVMGPSRALSRSVRPLFARPLLRRPLLTRSASRPAFFHPSTHFETTFFTHSRSLSTLPPARAVPRSLPKWLFGCSALVFGILVVGGLTRLTESGLSIVEWQPITGILPPLTQAEWDEEWEKYRVSPEGVLTNSRIEMDEFKKIFYMEWAHRIAGRVLGVGFVVPMVYYMARYRLPRKLQGKLLLLGLGIGFQGALGWYMVKSGLDQEIIDNRGVPRVSQYRLAAHLSAALALYVGMLHTALSLRQHVPNVALAQPDVRRFARVARVAGAMVFLTAVSGAFVAGLDAGLVYNEFPTMGGRLVPPTDELLDQRYARRPDGRDNWWRNMLENPVTAQFDHRLFATTTFTVLLSLPLLPRVIMTASSRQLLPRSTMLLARSTAAAAIAQVTLGITTLLYLVPVPLAAAHQAGSVVLLTLITGLVTSLRRPGQVMRVVKSL
ncbi:cytochrome oxidase assembly protein-domain-containing protein [Kockovaella imperatae]|uniref:Cytochrome oxidase assembly protein-domain-containing protein n=1 Tax=Kockovaella imperatae TaxID=4999 RepID=A0A1Y1USJ2_9TREE|nr:cytochrome oxidase assembly protein-domain-containing protein [Kockovaella imperatae]ORX40922.1 cytochrome oxidase assembly protein-domain-containing protein [Kockovaella imperatae]